MLTFSIEKKIFFRYLKIRDLVFIATGDEKKKKVNVYWAYLIYDVPDIMLLKLINLIGCIVVA